MGFYNLFIKRPLFSLGIMPNRTMEMEKLVEVKVEDYSIERTVLSPGINYCIDAASTILRGALAVLRFNGRFI